MGANGCKRISGGTPVIRNTSIPVYDLAASVAKGLPMNRILADYPALTAEMANLAVLYATANPHEAGPGSIRLRPPALFGAFCPRLSMAPVLAIVKMVAGLS